MAASISLPNRFSNSGSSGFTASRKGCRSIFWVISIPPLRSWSEPLASDWSPSSQVALAPAFAADQQFLVNRVELLEHLAIGHKDDAGKKMAGQAEVFFHFLEVTGGDCRNRDFPGRQYGHP